MSIKQLQDEIAKLNEPAIYLNDRTIHEANGKVVGLELALTYQRADLDQVIDKYIDCERRLKRFEKTKGSNAYKLASGELQALSFVLHTLTGDDFFVWIDLVTERRKAAK